MALIVVGVSHHGAPLEVRERLAYRTERGARAFSSALRDVADVARGGAALDLQSHGAVPRRGRAGRRGRGVGAVRRAPRRATRAASGTCVATARPSRTSSASCRGWTRWSSARRRFTGRCATRGRRAGRQSGAVLNRLFQTALLVGGRVRSETALGHGALSVSSAAVQLAKKIFGSLVGKRAMVLGAGEMAELALASLQAEGVRAAIVANRTFERAQALAATLRRHGGALRGGLGRARRRGRAALLDRVAARPW